MPNKFLKSLRGEGSVKPSQSQPLNPIFFPVLSYSSDSNGKVFITEF